MLKNSDYLIKVAWLFLIVSICIVTYYMVTQNINHCTSDPLEYAVEKYHSIYEAEFIYGSLIIANGLGGQISIPFGDIKIIYSPTEYNLTNISL